VAIFKFLSKNGASRRWGSLAAAGLLSFTLYGCGSSDTAVVVTPPVVVPPTATNTAAVIAAEAAKAANDTATNPTAPFSVMGTAGLVPVTITNQPVVNFSVFDNGAVKTGLTTSNATFTLSKLVPGAAGSPSKWVNYIWGDDAGGWGMVGAVQKPDGSWTEGTPVVTDQTKARTAGSDPKVATQLVYNADGYYTYTFQTNITDATRATAKDSSGTAVTFEPGRVHRLSLQLSYTNAASETVRVNPYYDFTVGADGKSIAAANPKQVVDIRSCNNCHESLAFHGGGRVDVTLCVQCHQPGSIDKGTGLSIDLMTIVHRIHAGKDLPSIEQQVGQKRSVVFRFFGGSDRSFDYSFVGFPQSVENCVKCHDGTASATGTNNKAFQTAQGNNWFNVPNRAACGSCHDTINFATGGGTSISGAAGGHAGLNIAQADDSKCALCHTAADIKLYHVTGDPTPNNPTVPVGAANFTYEINSATVNASNETVIQFRIKKDGVNLDLSAADPTGFTGGPGFLFAWAMGQDGVASPADHNNLGTVDGAFINSTTRGDAFSRSLSQLRTAPNTLTYDAATGWNTATVKAAAFQFPAGAKMRTVGLQSYWTQTSIGSGRHTPSVVKTVTGDTARRSVVDNAKCADCHDWLALHGGSRVYEVQICVMCHNPSKATSGRGITDAVWNTYTSTGPGFSRTDSQILALWGFNLSATDRALQFPVVSNNLKDMIHGMHAQRDRAMPIRDARDRTPNAITLLDFSRIGFPGVLQNCETCHRSGTYAGVPAAALASTQEFRDAAYVASAAGATTTPAIAKASLTQPNPGDVVASPFAAACVSCHDGALAKSHIGLNGGVAGTTVGAQVVATDTRSLLMSKGGPASETCALCHGAGKIADVTVVHQ